MKKLKSIRLKLILIALLPVFIITSLVVYSDVQHTRMTLIDSQKEKAVLLSNIIKKSLVILMIENKWYELQSLLEDFTKESPELKEVRIFNPDTGYIIASADEKDIGKKIYERDWEVFKRGDERAFIIEKDGLTFATRVSPILNEPACYRCHSREKHILGVIDVEVSLERAGHYIKESSFKHFSGLAIGFVFISIIFIIGSELIINKPIKRLAHAMQKVESGDLTVRLKSHGYDEISYLTGSFNNMISSLEAAKKEIESYHIQQMEKASRLASLGEIMSGIAHEIKNPLTGISCAIQVLCSEIGADDSKKEIVNEVLNQIKRLDRTVKDLLDYAKPKPPSFSLLNLREPIEKALFLLYPEAKRRNVDVTVEVSEDMPMVIADSDQMQQVFLNLSLNAVHAMPNGGTLKIKLSQVDYDKELQKELKIKTKENKIAVIRFEDTGIGIAPEDIDKIFEPFFTKKTKGTGLGLPISYKIVQEHGGDIDVKSEVGKGSVFSVYLPISGPYLQGEVIG